jgi:RNA polymerase sigma-70 factor (ECF subfamily)
MGLRSEEAEEIVQETFIALLRHLRLGRPRTNLRGWIFRVAHNLALKCRRRSGRTPLQSLEGAVSEAEGRPDPAPNPEEQLASGQRRVRLLAVVRALPERDRSCLFMRAEGLGYREIAGALGVSLGWVCLSVKRSLDRLARVETA